MAIGNPFKWKCLFFSRKIIEINGGWEACGSTLIIWSLAPGEEGACTPRVLWPEPFPANHFADHVAADFGVGTGYFTDGDHPTNCNW